MNKWQIICPVFAILLVVIVGGVIHELGEQRHYTAMATDSIGRDLTSTTNSPHLAGIDPELHARLSELLRSRASVAAVILGDEELPTGRGKACSQLVVTNDLGEGLAMRLGPDRNSWFFRVLSYKQITEPGGAANRRQPTRSETNRASAAAGSGR